MSSLNSQRWRQIGALFEAALGQPAEDRTEWLAEACPDSEVRLEVEAMLGAHERTRGILETTLGSALDSDEDTAPSPEPLEPDDEPTGEMRVGPYKLVKVIGRGGMGVVYQGHDPRLDRFVALKFLPRYLRQNQQATTRFLGEAQAASALDHPNICTIYDVGETEDNQLYIAMAYYDGPTLRQKIEAGPLVAIESCDIALQVAEALRRAHDAGIIHRDIKPSNIVLTDIDHGQVKILDFGVAKLEGRSITESGARLGTIAYMSPEQAAGQRVDQRTDLWSLGVVLYEMLAGHPPFRGRTMVKLLQSVLESDPLPLSDSRPDAPVALAEIVGRCLVKDREQRYNQASEIIADLKAWRGISG